MPMHIGIPQDINASQVGYLLVVYLARGYLH